MVIAVAIVSSLSCDAGQGPDMTTAGPFVNTARPKTGKVGREIEEVPALTRGKRSGNGGRGGGERRRR
ncbi:hypothetical protein GCM10022214_40850 [Actinomadura miaoliensis]|uniref:Uncharacterized protein n=1 Tax=Actinomadura miaoliensis TaxID=430685 RepID=A0ABP7W1R6_9ACTN